jgi:hypothetical protein
LTFEEADEVDDDEVDNDGDDESHEKMATQDSKSVSTDEGIISPYKNMA